MVGSVRQARPPSPPLTESAATSDHWFNTTQYYHQSGTNKVPLNWLVLCHFNVCRHVISNVYLNLLVKTRLLDCRGFNPVYLLLCVFVMSVKDFYKQITLSVKNWKCFYVSFFDSLYFLILIFYLHWNLIFTDNVLRTKYTTIVNMYPYAHCTVSLSLMYLSQDKLLNVNNNLLTVKDLTFYVKWKIDKKCNIHTNQN